MKTVLITGANRGIGLEFVRSFAEDGWRVWASCRQPETALALQELVKRHIGQITLHPLDVTKPDQRIALKNAIGATPLDLLINNAGVLASSINDPFAAIDETVWLEVMRVNCIAPFKLLETFTSSLAQAPNPMAIAITSFLGSIAETHYEGWVGGWVPYRTSKAALNMAMKSAAIALAAQKITVLLLHPGWVKTDMGGEGADITVQESVAGMRSVIAQAKLTDTGRFLAYDGSEVAW